jgi:hypothetical protein
MAEAFAEIIENPTPLQDQIERWSQIVKTRPAQGNPLGW